MSRHCSTKQQMLRLLTAKTLMARTAKIARKANVPNVTTTEMEVTATAAVIDATGTGVATSDAIETQMGM